jgi:Family of unknown function (DUF6788)
MKKRKAETVQSLQKLKQRLLKTIRLPEEALPGSLSVSRFRCGKRNCHCSQGEGHEKWALTYMRDGAKRVRHIPADLVESVRTRVEQGKRFKEEVNEVFGANAELFGLLRKDYRKS